MNTASDQQHPVTAAFRIAQRRSVTTLVFRQVVVRFGWMKVAGRDVRNQQKQRARERAELTMAKIQQATDIPTRIELVARAVALKPMLVTHASDGDINRRQADEVIDGLTAAGFFRLLTPVNFGGYS